ncbi:adenine-specific DNA-methyltransferase [Branchiibius hedensis]|uniref:Adenine-specific DNA-methyltransferase n=1 Tax=Branchiibius hedensis TaxID=672460 RepID=A0A2Y9BNS4_9MICO|nr:adenine-specific DNA-methyltransferase [Branchiibius hedensis]SSA58951.1 adenine-specific DNA-methyltransferase [Branchiibius hedensis]
MSNELRSLLARVESSDPDTAKELRRHIDALQSRREFGLNFERHTPESVALTGRAISVGDKVRFIPVRGQTEVESEATWRVVELAGPQTKRVAQLVDPKTNEITSRPVDDLVYIAEFKDPVFPGLVRSDEPVLRGGDKPFHAVINAENYHALEAMLFTYQGTVDCIYIDPPYNTGAKDWKYNNDYVDGEDSYRHSKWLAFMERRLKLARQLLNPRDSVLIVTIDEKEYLRLGLLLEQVFPEADIQMVSCVINRAGSPRTGRFSRVDEYIYYVFLGGSQVEPWTSTMLSDGSELGKMTMPTVWFTAVRRGSGASRAESKSLFYPVIIHRETGRFIRVGDPVAKDVDRASVPLEPGELAIWPLGAKGQENRWRFSAELMRNYFEAGTARLGKRDAATGLRPVTYLQPGTLANIANGTFKVAGHTSEGALTLELVGAKTVAPRTVWSQTSHFARDHGSHLLAALVPDRRFPFPKSLYAVEDALRFVVASKPNALVLDFFSGSGTTAHAIMRLNKQDGGQRRAVCVTNNEVSADEQRALVARGLRPGDSQWEALGICDLITKPRIRAAITGLTPGGDPIVGDYKFTDEFPMSDGFDENVEFFTLTYENPALVELDLAFERVAPLLWMRAGSQGRRIDERSDTFDLADAYAVLFNVDAAADFVAAIEKSPASVRIVYIVTDDETQYQAVASQLPEGVETVRLYESYLRTFQINTGRA